MMTGIPAVTSPLSDRQTILKFSTLGTSFWPTIIVTASLQIFQYFMQKGGHAEILGKPRGRREFLPLIFTSLLILLREEKGL